MIVALDGPSGAGKSTIARRVAHDLGFSCLDTGAMYRACALAALQADVPLSDGEAIADLMSTREISFAHVADASPSERVLLDGVDITADIRTAAIDAGASQVSGHPAVRHALVLQQQRIGREGNYVVEGRDIGTVVFPDAEVKVFLTATPRERARRRMIQNEQRGLGSTDFNQVYAELVARDEADSSREASPLMQADDAYLLDSTGLSEDEVVMQIANLAREARTYE